MLPDRDGVNASHWPPADIAFTASMPILLISSHVEYKEVKFDWVPEGVSVQFSEAMIAM